MAERSNNLRKYILEELENGSLKSNDKLPGARTLAKNFNITLPQAQMVLIGLMQDGIVETKLRNGSYIQRDWQERIVNHSFSATLREFPYNPICKILEKRIPELYIAKNMPQTTFEIKVTHKLLCKHDEYMDLMPIFESLYGKGNNFFTELLKPFIVNGKLCGIPLLFSPRLLIFNRSLLEKYNAPIPQEDWSWEQFIDLIKVLIVHLKGEEVFSWGNEINHLINSINKANGMLFNHEQGEKSVQIDSPNTMAGLLRHLQLREALNIDVNDFLEENERKELWGKDKIALAIDALPFLMDTFAKNDTYQEYGAVSIPKPLGGNDKTIMAAELLCIRKSCSDYEMAKEVVKTLLSSEVQNIIAQSNYSIPFRKSIANSKFKDNNHLTARFVAEIPKVDINYNIYSPELYQLVCTGVEEIMLLPANQVVESIQQLGNAVRVFLKYSLKKKQKI